MLSEFFLNLEKQSSLLSVQHISPEDALHILRCESSSCHIEQMSTTDLNRPTILKTLLPKIDWQSLSREPTDDFIRELLILDISNLVHFPHARLKEEVMLDVLIEVPSLWSKKLLNVNGKCNDIIPDTLKNKQQWLNRVIKAQPSLLNKVTEYQAAAFYKQCCDHAKYFPHLPVNLRSYKPYTETPVNTKRFHLELYKNQ